MDKYLLFSTGAVVDYSDLETTPIDSIVVFNSKHLSRLELTSVDTLTLTFFDEEKSIINLKIKGGKHGLVIQSICNAIRNSVDSVVVIADVDNDVFVNSNINGVKIKTRSPLVNYVQTLTNTVKTKINVPRTGYKSCMISNLDTVNAVSITLELFNIKEATYTKFLSTVAIPINTTLKLDKDEIYFDNSTHELHATSGDADGQLTFTFNH